jgi:pyruvate dehydrogenase E2 component (dihydrolipoamide acetyltransferase)
MIMAIQVLMPKIGLTMSEGKIVEWKKREGEWVEKGEILFVFETEKVTFEVESPQTGFLAKILVYVDETVPIGTVVGLLVEKEGEKVEITPERPKAHLEEFRKVAVEIRTPPTERIRATPLARKMAKEHGLELRKISGSGSQGRIRRIDIEKGLQMKAPEPAQEVETGKLVKLTGMRRIIAQKMVATKMETAQTYMSNTIDATRILEAREKLLPVIEKMAGVRLTITDLLMKITALAISLHPVINTRWSQDGILWFDYIHMGMAMALEEGLIVPVIWDIGKKSLSDIARVRAELVDKGRKGRLTPDDIKGSTFTLSSLGMYGVEEFSAIINQPESAILAVGSILDKPVVLRKEIVIRPMMNLTLSYDHRVIDGAKAAQFMKTLKESMENPILILA